MKNIAFLQKTFINIINMLAFISVTFQCLLILLRLTSKGVEFFLVVSVALDF